MLEGLGLMWRMGVMRAFLFSLISVVSLGAAEDLTVLKPGPDGLTPDQQLEVWLKKEFYAMVDQRSAAFETMIKSARAMQAWQSERKAFFLKQIGGLPERTPLRAQVTGTLQGKGYRVEKIMFESRPGFHVTGNLYLPETPAPWPAVLVPCGHSHDGKAVGQYQRAAILLAKHGMAAMCYDPVGQGERYQMLDPTQQRKVFEDAAHVPTPHPNVRLMCTTEHTMVGVGSILLGTSVAQYRIWDGMRAIDYLQSRPDIRADKIGCTGNSGGGTLTAYLMALDERHGMLASDHLLVSHEGGGVGASPGAAAAVAPALPAAAPALLPLPGALAGVGSLLPQAARNTSDTLKKRQAFRKGYERVFFIFK